MQNKKLALFTALALLLFCLTSYLRPCLYSWLTPNLEPLVSYPLVSDLKEQNGRHEALEMPQHPYHSTRGVLVDYTLMGNIPKVPNWPHIAPFTQATLAFNVTPHHELQAQELINLLWDGEPAQYTPEGKLKRPSLPRLALGYIPNNKKLVLFSTDQKGNPLRAEFIREIFGPTNLALTVDFEQGMVSIFVEGQLLSQVDWPPLSRLTQGQLLEFGTDHTPFNRFNGYIGSVQIFNRLLSNQEIEQISNQEHRFRDIIRDLDLGLFYLALCLGLLWGLSVLWRVLPRLSDASKTPLVYSKVRNWGLIALTLVLFFQTYQVAIRDGQHLRAMPSPHIGRILSIVLSESYFGLSGYMGYWQVLQILKTDFAKGDKAEVFNQAFKEVLRSDIDRAGEQHSTGTDIGEVTLFKMAFALFGLKLQSIFYLYFVIQLISICAFALTYKNHLDALLLLVLYGAANLVAILLIGVPEPGNNLAGEVSIINNRFLHMMGVPAAMHLALGLFYTHRSQIVSGIALVVQAVILGLAIHIRSSAETQIMFIISAALLWLGWAWYREKTLIKALKKLNYLPIVAVIGVFLMLKLHDATGFNKVYTTVENPQHHFWCASLEGLSFSPEAEEKYHMPWGDQFCHHTVANKAKEQGLFFDADHIQVWDSALQHPPGQVGFVTYQFEKLAQAAYFEILAKDPVFVVKSFLYKIPTFFKVYFSNYRHPWSGIEFRRVSPTSAQNVSLYLRLSAPRFLLDWRICAMVILAGFLGAPALKDKGLLLGGLGGLWLFFSLGPSLIYAPLTPNISEIAIVFTMLLYLTLAYVPVGLYWYFCNRKHKTATPLNSTDPL